MEHTFQSPSLLSTLLITRARLYMKYWVCNDLCLVEGGVLTWVLEGAKCAIATCQIGRITFNPWRRVKAFSHLRSLSLTLTVLKRAAVFFYFKNYLMFALTGIILLKKIWKDRKVKRRKEYLQLSLPNAITLSVLSYLFLVFYFICIGRVIDCIQ